MLLFLSVVALLEWSSGNAVPPPSPRDPEIMVTGQRLKRIRVETRRDPKTGMVRCRVKRTSGDPALDGRVCDAVLTCARVARKPSDMEACVTPRLAAIGNPSKPQADAPD
ncbi:hypothetical protein [Sphingosinicella sp. BN140058]|uniref:hypothetical protein n=1 Tax=Sphingosinicella sp. BN140058 TaxID=1892855 RepID=UPI001012CA5A|nr:hypothetical protein [Sphingosinicella sp. BN140058]QAY75990.1 hypothetical protein ETR14_05200 [Sphingosinicella sp. BN140058]